MKRLLSLALMVLLSGQALAQGQLRRYSINNGLPGRSVSGVAQAPDGHIWIGTENGIAKFDSQNFKIFRKAQGLPHDEVSRIFIDHMGRVWVYCANGEFAYIQHDTVHNQENTPWLAEVGFSTNLKPQTAMVDRTGDIWFGHSLEVIQIHHQSACTDRLPWPRPGKRWQFHSTPGALLVVAQDTLLRWNGHSFVADTTRKPPGGWPIRLQFHQPDLVLGRTGLLGLRNGQFQLLLPYDSLPDTPLAALRDPAGNYLIRTTEGYWALDRKGGNPRPILRSTLLADILLQDDKGNIWFKAGDGSLVMVPGGLSGPAWLGQSAGLQSEFIRALARDDAGRLLVGHADGALDLLSADNTCRALAPPGGGAVLRILARQDGSFWVARTNDVTLHPPSGVPIPLQFPESVNEIQHGPGGLLSVRKSTDIYLASTPPNARFDHHFVSGLALKPKTCHAWTPGGSLWVASSDGLGVEGPEQNQVIYPQHLQKYITARIHDICPLGGDTLALATNGQGIIFCTATRILGSIHHTAGLPDLYPRRLLRQGSTLWAWGDQGLHAIDLSQPARPSVQSWTMAQGLPTNAVNDISPAQDHVAVATDLGLCILPIRSAVQRDPPRLVLRSVQAGSQPWRGTPIPWSQRNLRIQFTGIHLAEPSSVNYRFRIGGPKANWNPTPSNDLSLPALAAGRHLLEVQARSHFGPWSPSLEVRFTVLAPFWQRGWFFLLCFLSLAALGYGVYLWRVRSLRRRFRAELAVRARVNALEQQAFQAMMNPHFTFNVMNAIRHFMRGHEMDAADRYLAQFAKLLRANLDMVSRPLVPLEDEVAFLRDYLSLEALRLGPGLDWLVEVDAGLEEEDVLLPAMLLQPFVENAIWHGLTPAGGAGVLRVRFVRAGEILEVHITDDGVGMGGSNAHAGHTSRGIALIRERLGLLGLLADKDIGLRIEALDPSRIGRPGTRIIVRLPLDLPMA